MYGYGKTAEELRAAAKKAEEKRIKKAYLSAKIDMLNSEMDELKDAKERIESYKGELATNCESEMNWRGKNFNDYYNMTVTDLSNSYDNYCRKLQEAIDEIRQSCNNLKVERDWI